MSRDNDVETYKHKVYLLPCVWDDFSWLRKKLVSLINIIITICTFTF